ncbi:helix-turn-helix domain-containing protein [Collimonas humicola]|uniref:helix-turn-helix domain-containing protein n=1 Tax=Collimonas humicola TaxID=2825886 RepID=UPI001B8D2865|nr:helix-turn-helix transcriptional regulator [Collimonas humicola]
MSPFSITFRELRIFSGLRQAEFAAQLGYEQSYISAIELGTKGPPTVDFVARLIHRFELDEEWKNRLLDALEVSHRKIVLPSEASEELYKMFNELRRQLDKLHPAQVELMQVALRLPESILANAAKPTVLPRRKIRRNKNETGEA